MTRPRVFITRLIAKEALDKIAYIAEIDVWTEALPPPHNVILEKTKDVEGLLTMLTDKIDASIINAAPKLKVISNLAVGYDNIDVTKTTERGIPVGNTPGVLSETTADLAFALLMAAARQITQADKYCRSGRWQVAWGPMILLGQDIHHSTLGITGMGRIGTEVARRARGFQMHILYHDKHRHQDIEQELGVEYVTTLPALLARSDFVSLHVPLTEETRKMIGPAEFAIMKPTAILVNTSRGQVVDQKALYEALKSGQIAAAAIDVTEIEPIPSDDPLLTLENIIISPHIGSASTATRTKMAVMAADNLIAGLKGERLVYCINPEVFRGKG